MRNQWLGDGGIMTKLDLLDICERGNKDFEALSEIEKNLYVLLLFFQLYDMEGMTHFFSHELHHLPRLLAFLAAAEAPNYRAVSDLAGFLKMKAGGSWDQDALDRYFCRIPKEDVATLEIWDREYDSKAQDMWARVKEYVRQRHGVDFN
jgi:hypothetical protein